MLSVLLRWKRSYPAMLRVEQQVHQRFPHPDPCVLGANLLILWTNTQDRDRPVSRRSEPSSRAALRGELPHPWGLLQSQDATSRHRGAEPGRRCGRSNQTSLLSPE